VGRNPDRQYPVELLNRPIITILPTAAANRRRGRLRDCEDSASSPTIADVPRRTLCPLGSSGRCPIQQSLRVRLRLVPTDWSETLVIQNIAGKKALVQMESRPTQVSDRVRFMGKRPAPSVAGRSGRFCLFENPLYRRRQCVEPELQRVWVLTAEPGVVALIGTEDVIVRARPEVEAPAPLRVSVPGRVGLVGFDTDNVPGADTAVGVDKGEATGRLRPRRIPSGLLRRLLRPFRWWFGWRPDWYHFGSRGAISAVRWRP
jgi:hypothetical protein